MRLVARGEALVQWRFYNLHNGLRNQPEVLAPVPRSLRVFGEPKSPGGLKWQSTIFSTVPEAQLSDFGINFRLTPAKKLSRLLQGHPTAHERFQVREVHRRPRSFSKDRAGHGGNLDSATTNATSSLG
jgi:hypothetical protein